MSTVAAKTVADPNREYESLTSLWRRCRAVCGGERHVKELDSVIDTRGFSNILIPFSPSMTQQQYSFYRTEAELPGICAQFSKLLVGGLLRKPPTLTLPDSVPQEVSDWIINEFSRDDGALSSFLHDALTEEVLTSRAWVFVDYPRIPEGTEEFDRFKPYPVLQQAENIINWRTREDESGKIILDRVVVRGYVESYEKNEFHPELITTIWVHELDDQGLYRIRIYRESEESTDSVPVITGRKIQNNIPKRVELVETVENVMVHGERLDFIPAWPLNGCVEPTEPLLCSIVDREIALYNKISRRNHLLYGAATYTPIISSDMPDDEFERIVNSGLGTWIRLRQGDVASVLDTPTEALADMDRAIQNSIEEMARLGLRMLTPETNQSGVALEIRNASQTAQLGALNTRVSDTIKQVIRFMINWRYDYDLNIGDVDFALSPDFERTPFDSTWTGLITDWYQQGLIPRNVWIGILKQNEILPPDYDDEEGQKQINADSSLFDSREEEAKQYAEKLKKQLLNNELKHPNPG